VTISWSDKVKAFFGFIEIEEDEAEIQAAPIATDKNGPAPIKSFKGSLINMRNAQKFPASEIKVIEPRIYEDSLQIATHLRENKPVIVNLKYLDADAGKRLVDFVCGTAYAINGHMMKIGENIFLFTPANILIAEQSDQTPLEQGIEREEKEVFFRKVAI
jgi:cell division inhibitor SepF